MTYVEFCFMLIHTYTYTQQIVVFNSFFYTAPSECEWMYGIHCIVWHHDNDGNETIIISRIEWCAYVWVCFALLCSANGLAKSINSKKIHFISSRTYGWLFHSYFSTKSYLPMADNNKWNTQSNDKNTNKYIWYTVRKCRIRGHNTKIHTAHQNSSQCNSHTLKWLTAAVMILISLFCVLECVFWMWSIVALHSPKKIPIEGKFLSFRRTILLCPTVTKWRKSKSAEL